MLFGGKRCSVRSTQHRKGLKLDRTEESFEELPKQNPPVRPVSSETSTLPLCCSSHAFSLAFSGKSEVSMSRNVAVNGRRRKIAVVTKVRCSDVFVACPLGATLEYSIRRTMTPKIVDARGRIQMKDKTGESGVGFLPLICRLITNPAINRSRVLNVVTQAR